MRAWSRTDLLVALSLAANVGIGALLLRANQRISDLERRDAERIADVAHTEMHPAGRGDSRGGSHRVVPARLPSRAADDQGQAAPANADEAFARIVTLADADEEQEKILRAAFDRRRDRILSARRAGNTEETKALWREYCDEVRDALTEGALRRIGCQTFVPPPPPPDQAPPSPANPRSAEPPSP
jgi:hypothetical protein